MEATKPVLLYFTAQKSELNRGHTQNSFKPDAKSIHQLENCSTPCSVFSEPGRKAAHAWRVKHTAADQICSLFATERMDSMVTLQDKSEERHWKFWMKYKSRYLIS